MSTHNDTPVIAQRLLAWGAGQRADLPWRQERTPYRVWVSEVMLQQTQVATAIPYFLRFMARFPTIQALAAAPLDDVLKAWEGLGYYARARNLHRAAQTIAAEHGGELPADRATLLRIPGIGRYTAGAILSLAFGQDEPVLDGNVRRVLCRLFAIEEDPRRAPVERQLWDLAHGLMPPGQAGTLNEALMDLGALVCRPLPLCDECPVQSLCRAYALGIQKELPRTAPRARTPHYHVTAGVIFNDAGEMLVAQRPYDKLLGGLWEFPGGKCHDGELLPDCLARELREELDIEVAVGGLVATVQHAYSHFRITLHAFACTIASGTPRPVEAPALRWVSLAQLDELAFSAADRKVIAALRAQTG